MSKVKVAACSGIGKVFGLLSREAGLKVTEELCPEFCEAVCLARVMTADEDAKESIEGKTCIAVDGCPKMCAAKTLEAAGGNVKATFRAVDTMRAHRGEDAGTGTYLTEAGWNMAGELAKQVSEKVKELAKEEA